MCQTSDQAKFVMISPEKNNDFYQKSIFIDLQWVCIFENFSPFLEKKNENAISDDVYDFSHQMIAENHWIKLQNHIPSKLSSTYFFDKILDQTCE